MTSNSEAPAKPDSPALEVRKLGKYELQKQLGAGGMGTVYLAKDTVLKRLVALKVLPADKAKNAILVRRFLSEAQAAAQLRHDHIVSVYENGDADGHLFIAMEYVDGTDLHELIRKRGKIPIKRSLEIVKQVAQALQHAYEHRIVHRDIKPSNLLIRNDGVVKLTDLGLARSVDDTLETDITRAGTTVGTVDYMSPEQGRSSKSADIRSDIYSLGCTWYHMLTGVPPFSEGSMTNKLQAHAISPLPNPQDLNENVTEGMVAVIQRMMAKKPQDRYQTPAELLKDLASPSLTRGGVAQEVMSAINEDTSEPAVLPKAAKRGLPAGALPPKNKAKAEDEEERPSLLDWETLQPLLWGAVILAAISGLGSVVAYFSGSFDFGSGKITKIEDRPNAVDNGAIVQSPQTAPPGANNQQADLQPGVTTVASPTMEHPNEDGTDNPDPSDPAGALNSQTVVSPNNPNAPDSSDPADPNSGAASDTVAQSTPSLDAEEIPDWSNAPPVRSQQPNSTSPTDPKSAGDPKNSTTTKNSKSNPPGTSNTPGNPRGAVKPGAPGTKVGTPLRPNPGTSPAANVAAASPQHISIGRDLTAAARGPALAEALKSPLSPEGVIIQLTGPGPYFLPQIQLEQIKRLALVAADGPAPILVMRPAPGESTAGLQLTDGMLELEGLHFVLDRSAFGGSDPVSMVASIDGQLTVRQCSFTVWGTGTVPVRALHVDSRQEAKGLASKLPPRVLVDQVTVKGDAVTSLTVSRPTADVVVRESLLAGGQLPVIALSGKLPAQRANSGDKTRRAIRISQSTLFTQRTVMQVSADGDATPPSTSVVLQESVCATAGPAAETVLLEASNWPRTGDDSAKAKLVNLNWAMKESAAIGFGRLADLGPDTAIRPQQLDAWQALWNKTFHASQFPASTWPGDRVADLSSSTWKSFDRSTLPPLEARRSDGTPPGCDVTLLTEPASGSRRWLAALSVKPTFPAAAPVSTPAEVITLDISKQQDLGTLLQNGTWPAGTVLEVIGGGQKQMTPVKLVDKSWKLKWRPQEGVPLTLTPKSSNDLPGLIVVEGGSLELTNLRFQIPAAKKSSITSLIAASNARLTLNQVWLQGPMNESNTLDALLSWSSGPITKDGTAPALACQNSVFTGSGSSIRLDLGASPAFLKNCLLVSRGDGIDVRFGPLPAGQSPGPLVADHLTVSAALGAFHLRSSTGDMGLPAHRFYVDDCVFAPPLAVKGDEKTPTLFSVFDPAFDLARVEWWGTANGVAPEIPAMIRTERDVKPNLYEVGLTRWRSAWSEEQDARLLTGAGGVVMTEQFPTKPGTVKPSQFALHSSAKAMKWAEGDKPIGADLRQMETPIVTVKPKDPKPATTTTKPKTTQPDF